MKKISVIVPVYNMEKYLVRCLESIVNQTYPDLEIICVNDGSTDSSAKILETYASKDKRIKLITKENGGLSSARNAGINAATGEFITFVDSDDWIQPDTYNIVSRYMSDADMLIFGTNVVGDFSFVSKEGDEEYYRVKYEGLRKLTDEERLNTDVSAWNKIYRLSIIKDNNIRFAEGFHYEDFAFFWQYSVMCKTVYYVKDKLYNYLRREGSIMAATFKKSSDKVIDHLKMSDVIYDFWINKGLYEEHKSAFKELFLNCFDFSMRYTRKQDHIKICRYAHNLVKKFNLDNDNSDIIKFLKCKKYYKFSSACCKPSQRIFSILKAKDKKIINILGLKFALDYKNKDLEAIKNRLGDIDKKLTSLEEENNDLKKELFYKLVEDNLNYNSFLNHNIDTTSLKTAVCSILDWKNMNFIFDNLKFLSVYDVRRTEADYFFLWGTQFYDAQYLTAKTANLLKKPFFIIEDGFLKSINTWVNKNEKPQYLNGVSFTIESKNPYYDATRQSYLEYLLNDKSLVITEEQKERARKCINKIVETHLTKYNHQPIITPEIGRKGVKKVLVVDQSYGDMSIVKGLANDNTFKSMLECAIKENPDADIIVKTHPDTMAGAGGYYKGLKAQDNIYTMTEPINPISLIKYCDKVYVCTTQFGFEALMCSKEVHVFGMPFYAGWGLTHDRQKCDRRTNTRTLEEIFYITYIMYSYYVNPDKKCRCEIEEAMDYLLKLREQYNLEKEAEACKV